MGVGYGYSHQLNPINPRLTLPPRASNINHQTSLTANFNPVDTFNPYQRLSTARVIYHGWPICLPYLGLPTREPSCCQGQAIWCSGSSWLQLRNNRHELQEEQGCCQGSAPQAPDYRRDGGLEAQEGLGSRAGSCKRSSHDRHHDVHVGQLSPDLQYHDGLYGIQEPFDGLDEHEPGLRTVPFRISFLPIVAGQVCVCGMPAGCTWCRNLEDQCHGSITNNPIRLADVGGAKRASGVCCGSFITCLLVR